MLFVKRFKKSRGISVIYFVSVSIVCNALPHFSVADSQGIINQLGSCFGACQGGSGGEACRKGCWKGYQIDLHPEIQEELNRKRQQEELNRKKHEEELKHKKDEKDLNQDQPKEELNQEKPQEKPQENIGPGDRLKRLNPNSQ